MIYFGAEGTGAAYTKVLARKSSFSPNRSVSRQGAVTVRACSRKVHFKYQKCYTYFTAWHTKVNSLRRREWKTRNKIRPLKAISNKPSS